MKKKWRRIVNELKQSNYVIYVLWHVVIYREFITVDSALLDGYKRFLFEATLNVCLRDQSKKVKRRMHVFLSRSGENIFQIFGKINLKWWSYFYLQEKWIENWFLHVEVRLLYERIFKYSKYLSQQTPRETLDFVWYNHVLL